MEIEQLHPQLRQAYGRIPAVPFHNRVVYTVISLLQKLMPNKIRPVPGVHIEDRPLSHGAVRIYRPEKGGNGAAILWVHGGGYIIGNVSTNDRECVGLVRKLGVTVVSVEYRLAPKHPFPAPLDDCFEAWQFMLDNATALGIDPARIAIAGQSAGGGLAAGLVQRIADGGGQQPAAQVLMYPMLDDRTGANLALDRIGHKLWSNKNNRAGWSWYLGRPAGAAEVPDYAAPGRRRDLSGLPETWLGVGELDLFYEEDIAYARRLQAGGVACEVLVGPQAPHAYDIIVPKAPVSQAMISAYRAFLGRVLGCPLS